MFSIVRRALPGAAALLLFGSALEAQLPSQLPTPAQAQQLLQTRPDLVNRLRDMMGNSGLTNDQIRSRLEAQGYPASLLDSYMPGSMVSADSSALPGDNVFSAMRALGVGDSIAVDSLRTSVRTLRARARAIADSMFTDTLNRAIRNDSTKEAIRSLLTNRGALRAALDSGFRIFGLDMFQRETSQFDPNMIGPVDANYRLGTGDQLSLVLTGGVDKSMRLAVSRDGTITIPTVGQFPVAGLTMEQLDDLLYTRLGRAYSGIRRGGGTTQFSVTLTKLGMNQIYVHGDVQSPGSYQVSRTATAFTALYMSGGPTPSGTLRNVEIRRNGVLVGKLDVYDYAVRGDASGDIRIQNGDDIFVPPHGNQVRLSGAVLRPATYELRPGERISDLTKIAGGFRPEADQRHVQVDRILPPSKRTATGTDRRTLDVPADRFAAADLAAGDVVHVFEIPTRMTGRLQVKGNVWNPGPVGFTAGMHLSEALHRAGGLRPDTYLGRVLVTRIRPDSSSAMLRSALFDTTGRAQDDITLADNDEITVFSLADMRTQRYITVGGAVHKPGPVPFHDGMTLQDAILFAGGLTENAQLGDVEIARMPENRAAGVTATTQHIAMDSSYVTERPTTVRLLAQAGEAVQGPRNDVVLQPYDAILIRSEPNFALPRHVQVRGKVVYPGEYTLLSKTERLSDVIKRAGGVANDGFANGIVFMRRNVGRVGVNLPEVMRNESSAENLALADGDSVFIPTFAPIVLVRGMVNSPVAVAFAPGADIDYYVRAGGGPTIKGDPGRAYVTQPNGAVESRHKKMLLYTAKPEPQAGSIVFVPEKDPTDHADFATIAAATVSIISSLVTLAAILKR